MGSPCVGSNPTGVALLCNQGLAFFGPRMPPRAQGCKSPSLSVCRLPSISCDSLTAPFAKTVCPSGLRGWTQVPLARAAWAQIPQLSFWTRAPACTPGTCQKTIGFDYKTKRLLLLAKSRQLLARSFVSIQKDTEGERRRKSMSSPGVEPGLSRPRRGVLTTRRWGPMQSSGVWS